MGETSTCHPDYDGVVKAKAKMAIVAKDINDYTKILGLGDLLAYVLLFFCDC